MNFLDSLFFFVKFAQLYANIHTGKLQTLSVTFTLRTSLLDVLGRPYMTSCKVFKSILTENTDLYLGYIINDDALPQPLVFIDDLSRKRLLNPEKLPRTSLWDVLQHIWQNFKQIDVYISPIHIELYTIQAVMCHPGHISRNKNDRQVLKKSKGRPYETSCNIFCNSFKQNYVYKSPKHIELFTHATYRAIKVIAESWKSQKDVLMRRPAT